MQIGELARAAGISVDTVRHYERLGLLSPARARNGYRVYDEAELQRLRFIRGARALGFGLGEIKELLDLEPSADADRILVRTRVRERLAEVERRIAELEAIRAELERLLTRCTQGAKPCPILTEFAMADAHAPPTQEPRSSRRREP